MFYFISALRLEEDERLVGHFKTLLTLLNEENVNVVSSVTVNQLKIKPIFPLTCKQLLDISIKVFHVDKMDKIT